MSHIKKVMPLEDFRLEVQLDNGNSIILNLKSKLETVRFGMLSNQDFFKTVTTDGDYLRWGKEIEISVSEIFLLVRK